MVTYDNNVHTELWSSSLKLRQALQLQALSPMAMASSAIPLPLRLSAASPNVPHSIDNLSSPNPNLSVSVSNPNPRKPPSLRSRLSKICQEGQPLLARQLFDTIPQPTTVLWNTIIIGFICNNMPHEALLLYAQMKKKPSSSDPHTKFDSYTYSSTLKACAETRNLAAGKAIHCHFIRCHSNPSRIVYNSLLNMYAACLSLSSPSDSDADAPEAASSFVGSDDYYAKYDLVRKVFDTMPKRDVVAFNTLLAWYVRTERYLEAIKQFRRMMKMGIKPSTVTFVNLFPAVSSMGDHNLACVFYGLLVKLGHDYVHDLFIVSSAVFMFSELGDLDFARKIFDSCPERNTQVWNTMISGYVQNNCPVEGIELFIGAMESEEVVLDDVTFLSALTSVSQLQQLDLARQLHAYIVKSFKALPIILLNGIIVMYSRCSSINTSFSVFHKMVERDIVTWNTLVTALVQNGLDDEGLMLVHEMQKQGFKVDSVSVTAILSAASNLRNQRIGKQTHAYILRHGLQFDGMHSYLIDMYAKSGLIRNSQRVFEDNYNIAKDHATWNAMIGGYTQNGMIEEAFALFRKMLEQKVKPNAVTLSSVLPACNPMANIDLGKQMHGFSIRNHLDQNVFVGTALVGMYSKSGAISYAENVFMNATQKNSVTCTTMILGYGQHGMVGQALALFYSMQQYGIQPDAVTFVAVLSACSYAGLVDEGLQIYNSMTEVYKIQPSSEHYCCVADMLGRVGRVVEAYEFVNELGEKGNVLEVWGTVLAACRLHGQSELGEVVAKKLHQMGAGNNTTGYQVLLSNIYAAEGNWGNVDRVRKEMREKGLRKEVGCSWIETSGSVNKFVSRDQQHPKLDEIYEMLDVLVREMKDDSCYSVV